MTARDTDNLRDFRLKTLAGMTKRDIATRSTVSGILFVLLLFALDWLQSQPIDIIDTLLLGAIFAVVLGLFDVFLRADARKKLK